MWVRETVLNGCRIMIWGSSFFFCTVDIYVYNLDIRLTLSFHAYTQWRAPIFLVSFVYFFIGSFFLFQFLFFTS